MKDPLPIWNQSVHFQFLRGQSVNVVCVTVTVSMDTMTVRPFKLLKMSTKVRRYNNMNVWATIKREWGTD